MNHEPLPEISIASHSMSRRNLLRAGGLTVTLAALASACTDDVIEKSPARVGDSPAPVKLPDAAVSDGVLFRTATSLHFSAIDSHNYTKKVGALSADQTAIVDNYIAANMSAIDDLQTLSEKAGSQAWTCANPRFDRVILAPIQEHIDGRPKTGSEEVDVAPSDNVTRDALALAHAMETMIAEMHQSLVPQLSLPAYRAAVMTQSHAAARRAAALALAINPANVVNPTSLKNATVSSPTTTAAAATTTAQNIAAGAAVTTTTAAPAFDFQQYYAISSQFGGLSAVQLAVGKPSGGSQFTINIETPSLNSFIYDYQTEC
ncbi:unannotated protein [freshwater metagenome]|uniref:Unannotated protein n=1 Tax=freshwater metagenome TaxID=449393 RepID=A0A6J7EU62_9ZZZZ|nr:hypothetical protein [Actinomycetota bacterium]